VYVMRLHRHDCGHALTHCDVGVMQVNEVLEALLQQLQAHNHPHAGAVQAAINLAGGALPGQKGMHSSQVSLLPSYIRVNSASLPQCIQLACLASQTIEE